MKKMVVIALLAFVLASCDSLTGPAPVQEKPAQQAQAPTATTLPVPTLIPPATFESAQPSGSNETWDISEIFGVTDLMRSIWTPGLQELGVSPELWPVFPNEPNPLVSQELFPTRNGTEVPNGLEFGQQLSVFCQQDTLCDFEVAARHYRLYSGDYNFPAIGESCSVAELVGCAISVWNVGEVTAIYQNQNFSRGYTVTGRYWNGDVIHVAMWGLMSNTSANMMNMETRTGGETLNQPDVTNAGANCSNPAGCSGADLRIVVISGNEVLWKAHTEIFR